MRSSRRASPLLLGTLGLVLVVGAWLRVVRLADRGLLFYDEGLYVLGGRFLYTWWVTWMREGWTTAQQYLAHPALWDGIWPQYAKPAHYLLVMFALVCGGGHFMAAVWANALLGIATLGALYWVGRRWFEPWVGVVAAAVLAVSCYHLAYARSAMAEADTILWFLLAVGLLAPAVPSDSRGTRERLFVGGLCGGIAFLSNYRLWMLLPSLWLMEILRSRAALTPPAGRGGSSPASRRASGQGVPRLFHRGTSEPGEPSERSHAGAERASGRAPIPTSAGGARLVWLTIGFLAPIAAWLILEPLLMASLPSQPLYAQQLWSRYRTHVPNGFNLRGWYAYPYLLVAFDGWCVALATGAGLVAWLWQRSWPGRALGLISGIVIGFFSVYQTHHARYISTVLPLLALAASWALVHGVRWVLRRRRLTRLEPAALVVLTAAVLLWRLPSALAWTRQRTGYADALRTLTERSHGQRQLFIATQPHVFGVFREHQPVRIPSDVAQLAEWIQQGARYYVVDYQLDFGGTNPQAVALARRIAASLPPVAVIPNPAGASSWVEFEHITDLGVTRRRLADPDKRRALGRIAIYDLWEFSRRRSP